MGKYNSNDIRIDIKDLQHPQDKIAVDSITAIPGFKKILEFISSHSIERGKRFINNSSRMKITEEMSPMLFSMIKEAAQMTGAECIPDVYIERSYERKVSVEGIKYPYILFTTSFLENISEELLWASIVSQFVGIKANHSTIEFIDSLINLSKGLLPFGVDTALSVALNGWYRSKAYTYDRAVLLATNSFEKAAEYILYSETSEKVIEGIEPGNAENDYMLQANEFLEASGAKGVVQKLTTFFSRNQWLASRYIELYKWYMSGEYSEIIERSE